MYIPNTMPSTIAEMYDFLEPTIEDGLFDAINETTVSGVDALECTQGGNTILTILLGAISGYWTFIPHPTDGINPDDEGTIVRSPVCAITNVEGDWCFMRCKGGVGFMYWQRNNSVTSANIFFIGKGTNGKTAFLSRGQGISGDDYNASGWAQTLNAFRTSRIRVFPIQFGDNTNLSLWQYGAYVSCWSTDADRTILQQLPIVGERGSTAYFTTLFARTAAQEPTHGRQLLGDHYYGCLGNFAIRDD